MAIFWLAATLGKDSTFKKLSKREILKCNVSKACRDLIEPVEPLVGVSQHIEGALRQEELMARLPAIQALRLSSNLMVGIRTTFSMEKSAALTMSGPLLLFQLGVARVYDKQVRLCRYKVVWLTALYSFESDHILMLSYL